MATEIDSLTLKIESSSTDAAAAIDRLVKAMKKLKKLDLSDAVSEIDDLCGAMDRLGASGSSGAVDGITSGLKKLGNTSRKAGEGAGFLQKALRSLVAVAGLDKLSDQLVAAVQSATEWDGIANRFGMGFGDQAQEVEAWADRLNQTLYINKQEFMRYAGTFASLANGFGVADEKVKPLATGLTELAYDLYAHSNDLYSFEEAMNAVRSAISGELEPIRNAGIAISEAMLKETAAAHGISQSVESMTESQKALLRYTAMIEQAADIGMIGTYINEINTAEGALRVLKQQVIGLGQALGGLFLPVLTKVLPYLQAFVVVLTNAVKAVMAFFGIDFQPVNWSKYSGVGGVADDAAAAEDGLNGAAKAAKKLKDYTMGFDELNVINPDTGSSRGSGASVGGGYDLPIDIKSLWDETMLAGVQNQVSKLVPKVQELLEIVLLVGGAFAIWKLAPGFQAGITTLLQGFSMIGKAGPLTAGTTMFDPLLTAIGTVKTAWAGMVGALGLGPTIAIVAVLAAVVYAVAKNWEQFKEGIKNALESLNFSDRLQALTERLKEMGLQIPLLDDVFGALKWIFEFVGKLVGTWLISVIGGVINALLTAFEGFVGIIDGIFGIVSGFVNLIVGLFTLDLQAIVEAAKQIGRGIIDAFVGFVTLVFGTVFNFIMGVISFFTELWDVLVGHSIVPDMITAIIDWFLSMPGVIMDAIIAWVGDVILWFTDLKDGAVEIFEEIWDKIKGVINSILGGVERMANGVVDSVNTIIGALNGMSFTVPDWAPELGGKKFGFEIGYLSSVSIPRLAEGGVLSTGQMFMAREAGPELVGNVGSRTAVLNNDQIVEAVSQGVYRAVVSALDSRGRSEQAVNVYLDGKQITSSVERRQKERGRTLMGTQVYSY